MVGTFINSVAPPLQIDPRAGVQRQTISRVLVRLDRPLRASRFHHAAPGSSGLVSVRDRSNANHAIEFRSHPEPELSEKNHYPVKSARGSVNKLRDPRTAVVDLKPSF